MSKPSNQAAQASKVSRRAFLSKTAGAGAAASGLRF